MPVRIYAHLSWTTWARLPLIEESVADFLLRFLLAEAKRHGTRVIEIGVVPNHVHLLLQLPPAYDVPRLVQGLKGASARLANRDGFSQNNSLRWETGYDRINPNDTIPISPWHLTTRFLSLFES
ncbi:MAG: hypothetical protein AUI08_08130 [Gemmatimonadetes bacterium 13_2_20CM_2_65_7]|nr:MAG: hypothetical protein AUI08_08130 [Gemmatimonadetes bacterium 13_2_20CM_2_65_7]